MMSTGKGYYRTMADAVNSRLSDKMKRELTGLLTKRIADKLWTAFDEGLKTGVFEGSDALESTEDAYKAGVLSLAAWMMAELEEAGEDKEGKEGDDDMRICMGLN